MPRSLLCEPGNVNELRDAVGTHPARRACSGLPPARGQIEERWRSTSTKGGFRTGDIGRLGADGYLRIEGRVQEVIISGGFNVYPREVEEVLLTHPGVAEVSVVGTPSEEWGETVTAFVVPVDQSPEPEALLAFAAERLAAYKCPKRVVKVDSLPRNAMGKVQRSQLVK